MKRISPSTVTVGVFAVLLGLVAAYTLRRYLEPKQAAKPSGVEVVVARINLPVYARIREQDMDIIRVPEKDVPPGAVTKSSRALFRLVRTTIMAGEPIREEQLFEVGKLPTLAEQVPPGMRAVTIAVEPNDALNGVLLPDSMIDIALTVRGDHPELAGVATMTLLRRVRVLATDRDRFRTEERLGQPLASVTVAVTPEQANRLILAQRFGTLSVTLRGDIEDQLVNADIDQQSHLINPQDLLGLPPTRQQTAQIWRGAGVQQITFNNGQIAEAERATASDQQGVPVAAVPASTLSPGPDGSQPAVVESPGLVTPGIFDAAPAIPAAAPAQRGG